MEPRTLPRISINKLAEYIVTTGPLRRQRIVRDQIIPPTFQVARYEDARRVMARHLTNPARTVHDLLGSASGVLPADVRETVILRDAARQRFGYEWSHHQRPARLAGLSDAVIEEITGGGIPDSIPDASQAALAAVDAVCAKRSIPDDVQRHVVAAHGAAGVVEIVVLCGLYATMGYMCQAFDIAIEDGLPKAPF